MAFYTAAQLYGTGSVGENLSGATTFTFVNSGDSSYFTLETNPNSTGSFAGRPTCANGTWTVSASMFPLTGPHVASVVVQPGSSSLIFTPTSAVTGTDYHLRGTGVFTLQIGPSVPVILASFVVFGDYVNISTPFGGYVDQTDLTTWYTASFDNAGSFTITNSGLADGRAVATNGTNWVVVGARSGSGYDGKSIFNSIDGKVWESVDNSVVSGSYTYESVAWGNEDTAGTQQKWVAAGSQSIATSYDGLVWSYSSKTFYYYCVNNGLDSGGQNLWLALGDPQTKKFGSYSVDANTWTDYNSNVLDVSFGKITTVVYNSNANIWLLGGITSGLNTAAIWKSTDAADPDSWVLTNCLNLFTTCHSIAFGDNNIVVAGGRNTSTGVSLIYSTDNGDNWTDTGNTVFGACQSVTWDGTYFIATGDAASNSITLYSTDGQNWTQVTPSTPLWKDGFAIASATGPQMYPPR